MEAPLRLSASAVRDFEQCHYRYARNYVQSLPDQERVSITTLTFGQVVHRVLAAFIMKGGPERVERHALIDMLRAQWQGHVYEDDELSMVAFERAADMLLQFHASPYPRFVARNLGIERRITWRRAHRGIMATGKIDRCCLLSDGGIELIDYKTGIWRLEPEQLAEDPQAAFYRSLGAEAFQGHDSPVVKVTFLYLASSAPVSVVFEEDEFRAAWDRIERVAGAIRDAMRSLATGAPLYEAFRLSRSPNCQRCPMRDHCSGLVASGAVEVSDDTDIHRGETA